MEEVVLEVQPRKARGKWAVRRLRREGWIPGIVYGGDGPPVPIQIPERQLESLVRSHTRLVRIRGLDGDQRALVRELQYDILGKELLHVDLHRLVAGQRVTVEIPIVLRGVPKGTEQGGVLQQSLYNLEVECLATAIPDEIRVDVSDLDLDDVLYVSQIAVPEGVTVLTEPDVVVAQVVPPEAEEAEEVVPEAAAEPEVIPKGKGEEAEGEQ